MNDYCMSIEQLTQELEEDDTAYLAANFDNWKYYTSELGLTESEQVDVERMADKHGNAEGVRQCLILWRKHNPAIATIQELLNILLKLRKPNIAMKVCDYYFPISKSLITGK